MDKKLSKNAYGNVAGKDYKPYTSNDGSIKEVTPLVVVIGLILAFIFAASNTYAGSIAGMTVAAGIPGAILGAGLMSVFTKKSSILNPTIIQGMASGGESVASGMLFVFPAVFLIGSQVGFLAGLITGLAGVFLGIAVTSILYNNLIIEEHGSLMYPESMAIAETLVVSDGNSDGLKIMGLGAGIAAIFTAIGASIFGLFNTTISYAGESYKWQWQTDANPMLLGIGFIVGMEVGLPLLAGGILANFFAIPLIAYFAQQAGDTQVVWNNADLLLNAASAGDIQGSFTKYIGAGMMLTGGFIGAIKLIPVVISSVKETFSSNNKADGGGSFFGIVLGLGLIFIVLSAIAFARANVAMIFVSIILAIIFIALFAVVSSRMTGTIGTSNLPVSGMTIASILIITVTFAILKWTTNADNVSVLLITTAVVTGISIAGGYAQSQKVSFVIGGNKKAMDKSFTIAAVVGVVSFTLVALLLAPQFGETIFPPQADLMATLTQGVLGGTLPWDIIIAGIILAFVLFMLDLPIMTVALGFYLPLGTVSILFIGACIRVLVKHLNKDDVATLEKKEQKGIIYASGLVAGGSLTGLLGSILAITTTSGGNMAESFVWMGTADGPLFNTNMAALLVLLVMALITFFYVQAPMKDKK